MSEVVETLYRYWKINRGNGGLMTKKLREEVLKKRNARFGCYYDRLNFGK